VNSSIKSIDVKVNLLSS